MQHRYSDTLRKVAPIIAEMRCGLIILRELALFERQSESPEMDVAAALYWVSCDFHDGQFSAWYRIGCIVGFKPGPLSHKPDPESPESYLYETIAAILGS